MQNIKVEIKTVKSRKGPSGVKIMSTEKSYQGTCRLLQKG